jgi:uncharacterized protein (TIGR02301 family)
MKLNPRLFLVVLVAMNVVCTGVGAAYGQVPPSSGQPPAAPKLKQPAVDPDARAYDAQIYRLSEILGALHYLRALCGADEGQLWRGQMRDLVNAEGTSALRRARLIDSFNKGYRDYARTYRTCTKPALVTINQFMDQSTSIADALVQEK